MHKAVTGTFPAYDVVILGAGYAGPMAALRLNRKRDTLRIALINASDRFLERVRLQESIVTELTPRISSISKAISGSFAAPLPHSMRTGGASASFRTRKRRRSCSIRPSTR